MTTRQLLVRHRRRSHFVTVPCLICLAIGFSWGRGRDFGAALVVISIMVFFTYDYWFGAHCVHCRRRVDKTFRLSRKSWIEDRDYRFCPFCGSSLDEEAKATQAAK
jgi:hypothetical protein